MKVTNTSEKNLIFTSTDFNKMFMDNQDFERQYLEFIFNKLWNRANENSSEL